MPYYHSRTWFGTEAFTYYNSHTSQHAEGSGHSIARFNTGKRVVIIHTILRFTPINHFWKTQGALNVLGMLRVFEETLELEITPIED